MANTKNNCSFLQKWKVKTLDVTNVTYVTDVVSPDSRASQVHCKDVLF